LPVLIDKIPYMNIIHRYSFLLAVLLTGCQLQSNTDWRSLFNEKDLTGWDTYLGPSYDTVRGEWSQHAVGLNIDPLRVFSVAEVDGAPAMRISGEHFGGISTKETFENYHLRLKFRWGQLRWHPRKSSKRDSGVLYHAVGDHGADFGFWMRSQEYQVQEGDCGDYWGVAGGSFEIPARRVDSAQYIFDPKNDPLTFNEDSPNGRRCIKSVDMERPFGEWNEVEILCYGDTTVHIMNGKTVMVLYRSAQLENGNIRPLRRGKIQLQSEGAEIYYRDIEIRSVKRVPAEVLAAD